MQPRKKRKLNPERLTLNTILNHKAAWNVLACCLTPSDMSMLARSAKWLNALNQDLENKGAETKENKETKDNLTRSTPGFFNSLSKWKNMCFQVAHGYGGDPNEIFLYRSDAIYVFYKKTLLSRYKQLLRDAELARIRGITSLSYSYGYPHLLLCTKEGEVFGSGNSEAGQLGLIDTDGQTGLIKVHNLRDIQLVAAGYYFSLAADSHQLWGWGASDDDQLGELYRDKNEQKTPQLVFKLEDKDDRIKQIKCSHHTLLLTEKGKLYGWRDNSCGQLGGGEEKWIRSPRLISFKEPVEEIVVQDNQTWIKTRAGAWYTCGQDQEGHIRREFTPWEWKTKSLHARNTLILGTPEAAAALQDYEPNFFFPIFSQAHTPKGATDEINAVRAAMQHKHAYHKILVDVCLDETNEYLKLESLDLNDRQRAEKFKEKMLASSSLSELYQLLKATLFPEERPYEGETKLSPSKFVTDRLREGLRRPFTWRLDSELYALFSSVEDKFFQLLKEHYKRVNPENNKSLLDLFQLLHEAYKKHRPCDFFKDEERIDGWFTMLKAPLLALLQDKARGQGETKLERKDAPSQLEAQFIEVLKKHLPLLPDLPPEHILMQLFKVFFSHQPAVYKVLQTMIKLDPVVATEAPTYPSTAPSYRL